MSHARKQLILTCLICLAASGSYAQKKRSGGDYTAILPAQWIIPKNDTLDYEQGNYLGSKALILKRKFEDFQSASIAYPKNLDFRNGSIELDIASPAGKAGYLGFAFRIRDAYHYQAVYFRPGYSGTHQAMQCFPVKKRQFNYWLYEDKPYMADPVLPLTGWFHVRAVIRDRQLKVYIDRRARPVYVTNRLDHTLWHGAVGFLLGNSPAGAYKNLVISEPPRHQ